MSQTLGGHTATNDWLRLSASNGATELAETNTRKRTKTSNMASDSVLDPRAEPVARPALAQEAKILQYPGDLLLLVRDHLDTASAISLALTCRSAYKFCFSPSKHTKLCVLDKRDLLQLLERDPLMPGRFYCHSCNILHPFSATWGPHSQDERRVDTRKSTAADGEVYHCGRRDRFAPVGNEYDLTYVHARLVMNAHFYGPDHGIPLANICVEQKLERDAGVVVHCGTAARIIDQELYVRRAYHFSIPDDQDAVDSFRRCTGARDFRVCEHTSLFSNSSVYRQCIPEIQKRPGSVIESPTASPSSSLSSSPIWCTAPETFPSDFSTPGFVPCEDAPGSCGLCLMDFDVTIREPGTKGNWRVIIRAYHQLGPCRSPDDWRWARFSESSRPHLFFPNRPNRRGSAEFPGAARKRWFDDGGSEEIVDMGTEAPFVMEDVGDEKPPIKSVEVDFRDVDWTQDETADEDMDDFESQPQLRLGTVMEFVPLGSPGVSPTNDQVPWGSPSPSMPATPQSLTQTWTLPSSPVEVPPWLWTQWSYPMEWGVL